MEAAALGGGARGKLSEALARQRCAPPQSVLESASSQARLLRSSVPTLGNPGSTLTRPVSSCLSGLGGGV
eukprot:15444513-Alexandrium_andersonii.AAC.1